MGIPCDKHPNTDVLLFAIGNHQGISSFVDAAALERGIQHFMREACITFTYTTPNAGRQPPASTLSFYAPRGFTEDLPDCDQALYEYRPEVNGNAHLQLPNSYLVPKPLKWQADQVIYTDGSIQDTGEPEYYRSGTGVFRPASGIGPCIHLCINPVGHQYGVGNTIQRAETVGLFQAFSIEHHHHSRVIAIHSLCAMYMLSKHLRCPSLHRESKHLGLLDATVQAMAESLRAGQTIQIVKVKSHIGIKGNEEADRLAHDACETIDCHEEVLVGLPIREHIHWPIQQQPEMESGGEGPERPDHGSDRNSAQGIPQGSTSSEEDDAYMPEHQVNDHRRGMKGYAKQTI